MSHFYKKFECDYKNCTNRKEDKTVIKFIACGAYHSMAITEEGQLYIWGESKLGQCGVGKKAKNIYTPQLLVLEGSGSQQADSVKSSLQQSGQSGKPQEIPNDSGLSGNNNSNLIPSTSQEKLFLDKKQSAGESLPQQHEGPGPKPGSGQRVVSVSGGYAHTVAITESGEVFVWGLNVKG